MDLFMKSYTILWTKTKIGTIPITVTFWGEKKGPEFIIQTTRKDD